MFGIVPRFGKIGVCIFQNRVLIAVPKLFLQTHIPGFLVVLTFSGTLRRILIGRAMWHLETSIVYEDSLALEVFE